MQFTIWAENRSLDRLGDGLHNIPNVEFPVLGMLAVAVGMALNVTAAVATISMQKQCLRRDPALA